MLRRFFNYYKPYRRLFILDFSCAVIAATLELAFPLMVNHVVDKLLPQNDWPIILATCTFLLSVYLLNGGLNFVVTYWGHMLGINIETTMRRDIFHHLQKLSFKFYDNQKTGHLMSRITNDLFDIGELAHHGPEDIFIAIMTLIGTLVVMLYINVPLALITFTIIPPLIVVAIYSNRLVTKAARQMFKDIADFNARIEDNIGGIRVVQAFANEKYERELFAVNNARFRATKLLSYKIIASCTSLSYMLTRLVSIFVLVCGAWFIFQNRLSTGEFIGFLLLSNILFRPIDKITAVIELYPKGLAGFKRYTEIMDIEPEIVDSPDAVNVEHFEGKIIYDDVSFGYDSTAKVLSHINIKIEPGETVAFVGPSGAGKTTLCSLLPRFYEISSGKITIDGTDIKNVKIADLRRQIGIVQQDVFLFSGTIRENIAYGKLDATDDEIWEAASRAQLVELIEQQPQGLDTIIGERGVKLSGGQKQRLSIARMFLKNPPILILDEATSALDTETENAIQQALTELSRGRTTLVIAHRLATIKNADRICVVTRDGIAETGTHQELLQEEGIYQRLHLSQFANWNAEEPEIPLMEVA